MNEKLQTFARTTLVESLVKLPEGWQDKFKMMYARNNGKRSVEDAKAMDMADVVAEMPGEKLDWAMQQVENSLAKLGKS